MLVTGLSLSRPLPSTSYTHTHTRSKSLYHLAKLASSYDVCALLLLFTTTLNFSTIRNTLSHLRSFTSGGLGMESKPWERRVLKPDVFFLPIGRGRDHKDMAMLSIAIQPNKEVVCILCMFIYRGLVEAGCHYSYSCCAVDVMNYFTWDLFGPVSMLIKIISLSILQKKIPTAEISMLQNQEILANIF